MGDGDDHSTSTVNTDATSSTGAQAMSITMKQLNTIIQSAIIGAWAAQEKSKPSISVNPSNPSLRTTINQLGL